MFILATSLSSQVNPDWRTYVMLAAYFFILLIIGYYGYKQATGDLSEYMLEGEIYSLTSQHYQPALLI